MTLIFGLTGGIATGKSTVAHMFTSFEIPIIDADIVAREVVEPGEEAYEKIVETFGKDILKNDQTLNRKKLGKIIFSDEKKRKQLNQITHPIIRKEMQRQKDVYIQQGEKCVILDIPLLFENNLTKEVDYTVVVYTTKETQLKRLMKRDCLTEEEAKQRINAQMSIEKKRKRADYLIDNNGTKKETFEQVKDLLSQFDML